MKPFYFVRCTLPKHVFVFCFFQPQFRCRHLRHLHVLGARFCFWGCRLLTTFRKMGWGSRLQWYFMLAFCFRSLYALDARLFRALFSSLRMCVVIFGISFFSLPTRSACGIFPVAGSLSPSSACTLFYTAVFRVLASWWFDRLHGLLCCYFSCPFQLAPTARWRTFRFLGGGVLVCGGTSCLPLFSFVLRSRRGSVWGVVLESQDTCRHLRYLFMISYFSQCLFFRSLYVLDARFFFPFLVRVPCRCLRHLLLSFLYCDIFVSFPTASRIRVSSRLFASFFFSTSWSSRKIDFRSIGVFATISKY